MQNLPSLSCFNFKCVPDLYTLRLSVRCGRLNLSDLPKSVHFLEVLIHVSSKFWVTICFSQVPDMNLSMDKRNTKIGLITSRPRCSDKAFSLIDLTQLNFDRFSAIEIKRQVCFYSNTTIIKVNDVSNTLNDFKILKCYGLNCDLGHKHFSLSVPQISENLVSCGMMKYNEIMKFE
ncbi:unnamed protein product [Ambrosiozyma monospora]|uniref:Unnamed protein product n=1 Tax=Ambrosiozyma monospora TaxID=43982 RepID=A0A9W6SZH0_AMBMO|nr:unnamed protein product [Ambrosiozyma monospora]